MIAVGVLTLADGTVILQRQSPGRHDAARRAVARDQQSGNCIYPECVLAYPNDLNR
jgi:hypothetical protein